MVGLHEMDSRVGHTYGQSLAFGTAPTESAERFRVHHAPVLGIVVCMRHV